MIPPGIVMQTIGPWGDELKAQLAGTTAYVTGADPAEYAARAMRTSPEPHPTVAETETETSAWWTPWNLVKKGLANLEEAERLYDDPAGQDKPWWRDPVIILAGLGILLIGVFVLGTSGTAVKIASAARKVV